ncbi:hypothetical protein PAMA_004877 [Pampus argenteus]
MENISTVSGGDLDSGVEYLCDASGDFTTVNGVSFILIFIFSVTGNGLLLFVLACSKNLKNVTNLFVLNLACSDLVFTVTLPFWIVDQLHQWVFGDFACKFITAVYFVGLYSSIILLTAMTVDRFLTVVHKWLNKPVRRQRCAMGACAAAWVISIAASVSDAINTEEFTWNDAVVCEASSNGPDFRLSYYLQVSLLFFLPFAIIIFCYSAILKTVFQASNRKRYRTVMMVLCIVAVFFICWGPYNIIIFVDSLHEFKTCYTENYFNICRILAFSHCCMNPLLFMLSQKARRHLLHSLCCVRRKCTANSADAGQNDAGMLDLQCRETFISERNL